MRTQTGWSGLASLSILAGTGATGWRHQRTTLLPSTCQRIPDAETTAMITSEDGVAEGATEGFPFLCRQAVMLAKKGRNKIYYSNKKALPTCSTKNLWNICRILWSWGILVFWGGFWAYEALRTEKKIRDHRYMISKHRDTDTAWKSWPQPSLHKTPLTLTALRSPIELQKTPWLSCTHQQINSWTMHSIFKQELGIWESHQVLSRYPCNIQNQLQCCRWEAPG